MRDPWENLRVNQTRRRRGIVRLFCGAAERRPDYGDAVFSGRRAFTARFLASARTFSGCEGYGAWRAGSVNPRAARVVRSVVRPSVNLPQAMGADTSLLRLLVVPVKH